MNTNACEIRVEDYAYCQRKAPKGREISIKRKYEEWEKMLQNVDFPSQNPPGRVPRPF